MDYAEQAGIAVSTGASKLFHTIVVMGAIARSPAVAAGYGQVANECEHAPTSIDCAGK
jgi:hypothetical protein